jgi:hypothetical protein
MKLPLNNYAVSSGYDTEAVEMACARCSISGMNGKTYLVSQVTDASDVVTAIDAHEDLFHKGRS